MVFQSIWYTLHIRFYTQGKTKYDSNKPKRKQKQRGKNCKWNVQISEIDSMFRKTNNLHCQK